MFCCSHLVEQSLSPAKYFAMGEEQLPESRKTPVGSKIKPDPKEKDLSGASGSAALSRWAGGQEVFGKEDIKPEEKPIDGIKKTAKLTKLAESFSDVG